MYCDNMRDVSKVLSQNVQKILAKSQINQHQLAEQCGVTKSQINHIIKGKSLPSIKLLIAIANATHSDINTLLSKQTLI